MRQPLDKIVADLNKKLGPGTVVKGSEASLPTPHIHTGSITLDFILGGGWPASQWSELVGDASSAKTALALHTVAENQRRNPDFVAVWIAAEKWVGTYAEMCGVDVSRMYVIETNAMEDAFDACIKFAESHEVDLVVIDSLPALVPALEDDKDVGESAMGRGALVVNRFFRKISKSFKRSLIEEERPICGLMINQWRMQIGGPAKYDNRTTPGGQGKNYAFFSRVELRRTGWIDQGKGADARRVGQSVRAKTIKNKSGPAQQTAEFDYYFAEGIIPAGEIDTAKELITLGVVTDMIDRKGSWLYYDGQKYQGAENMLSALREDIDMSEKLRQEVLQWH